MGKSANCGAEYVESLEKENAALKVLLQDALFKLDTVLYISEEFVKNFDQKMNVIQSKIDSMHTLYNFTIAMND